MAYVPDTVNISEIGDIEVKNIGKSIKKGVKKISKAVEKTSKQVLSKGVTLTTATSVPVKIKFTKKKDDTKPVSSSTTDKAPITKPVTSSALDKAPITKPVLSSTTVKAPTTESVTAPTHEPFTDKKTIMDKKFIPFVIGGAGLIVLLMLLNKK